MEKETWSGSNTGVDDNKWISTTVKQVRLIYSKDLTRLQSDMNQELLALTSAHNEIENIRTYAFTELNVVRYIGEITYTTPYLMKVPKEYTPTKPLENPPRQNETKATKETGFIGDKVVNKKNNK